ncbi:conserved hypothetical protein [Burkholderiales bacterium 8X]|nr:conserved hypothetical protein [Burkholderiales bacterium 8X]
MTANNKVDVRLDSATAAAVNDGKAFATLAARYALAGYGIVRSNPADGPIAFYVVRWGRITALASLDAAERFLKQIGGRA